MRDYGQYCPVALASEVLADRWTPLIVRELVLGSRRFNDIDRGLPGISRSLLRQRLRHLERKGVLERVPITGGRGHEYRLTPAGHDLEGVIMAFGEWAVRWMFSEPQPHEVDPVTLTWWMSRRLATDRLPEGRVVIEFDYRGPDPLRIWLVLDRGEPSVCTDHPGFPPDVIVLTDPVALMRVFSGIVTFPQATAIGAVTLTGTPHLVRALPTWFAWSPFAPAVRARRSWPAR
ncbi:winged helix-turn-helix transcriptional regulator [Actinomadura rudentiformis]|uniref:Helix-turn-helix transcriptional regulator n=1 Tax=Actinomadura rudentiformis TaxID=359158 RepID=A0A6H9YJB8_9ACTN|nr:helix-turn-helix domain-containing protein [Actinomadura rudentiformis]KAB2346933.1 helix-turn-helix transcriptional regulator [Actinomadura rudentiformis]